MEYGSFKSQSGNSARNVQKKRGALHMQSCFANLNILVFCRSLSRNALVVAKAP